MRLSSLSIEEKKLVLLATLLDPEFAPDCLVLDGQRGEVLSAAADELVRLAPELRIPLAASLLRTANSVDK